RRTAAPERSEQVERHRRQHQGPGEPQLADEEGEPDGRRVEDREEEAGADPEVGREYGEDEDRDDGLDDAGGRDGGGSPSAPTPGGPPGRGRGRWKPASWSRRGAPPSPLPGRPPPAGTSPGSPRWEWWPRAGSTWRCSGRG